MNPVYSPVQPGAPYGNPKNMAYTGYPTAYPAAAPAYNPSLYPTNSPSYAPGSFWVSCLEDVMASKDIPFLNEWAFLDGKTHEATLLMKQAWPQNSSSCGTEGTFHLPVDTGTENRTYQASSAAFRYTAGTPYKVPPTQSNTAPPPYSPSPNPYQTAMYPIRSAYPQQNLYAQGAYYTQPVYAAQPHVIHHTTVVQPNSIPSAIYPAPVAAPRTNGVAMGMVAGTTMAMSAGTLLTAPQHTAIGAHPVSMPAYRAQGTPAYSYVPPHWISLRHYHVLTQMKSPLRTIATDQEQNHLIRALSRPHLNVSHKSSVKWGWLAEGTAKFEKPHPEVQLNSW
ncbi:hypothetical protein EI555_017820, partial [Monodon monoceros]